MFVCKLQRVQSLHLMDIRNITLTHSKVKFRFADLLKQTQPGYQLGEITIKAFAPDKRLCLVFLLHEYLSRIKPLRGECTGLFMTTQPPFKEASQQTIVRWIKKSLVTAGLDMSIFTPHSTRSAAANKARVSHIPLMTILKTAGRSQTSTFAKYYKKTVMKEGAFAEAILNE